MSTTSKVSIAVLSAAGISAGLYAAGLIPGDAIKQLLPDRAAAARSEPPALTTSAVAPAVSVAKVAPADFAETVLVTGTLVPRDEILVTPEIEGLRVLELKVDEGARVTKGQILATLVRETLDAQLAQSEATHVRALAAIAQARSQIAQAEAHMDEMKASFERAKPLRASGAVSESVYDQREAAFKTADAQLIAARDGLKVAEAEKAQVEAQRREIIWRLGNTEVKSPADGIVSRRSARIGGLASSLGEPMFRIIARGEIELDAEVPEATLAKVREGQSARVTFAGGEVQGQVRLVSPEVDKSTRLGRLRVFLGSNPSLYIGAFARGVVETTSSRGLAVPAAAVMYAPEGPYVQVVVEGKVAARRIKTSLRVAGLVEVTGGLEEGDLVVAKAGTFLRDGDAVRPVRPDAKVSEATR